MLCDNKERKQSIGREKYKFFFYQSNFGEQKTIRSSLLQCKILFSLEMWPPVNATNVKQFIIVNIAKN